MLKFKKISTKINKLFIQNPKNRKNGITWINIQNPGKKEIKYLRDNYNFQLFHLEASSSKSKLQRPLVEEGDDYLFLVLHSPVMSNEVIISKEVEFFIGDNFIVTLHNNVIPLNSFFKYYKKDSESFSSYKYLSINMLLSEMLEKLFLYSYKIIDNNSIEIERIEDIIFSKNPRKAVSEILSLRRNILNTTRTTQNHKDIIKKIIEIESDKKINKANKKNLVNLLNISKRLWQNLENQKEMIEVLNNTNESLLNYNISHIMKTLTVLSVLTFPLTLFAAIFGMNTTNSMPLVDHPFGFWILVSLMFSGCVLMLIYFKVKEWL